MVCLFSLLLGMFVTGCVHFSLDSINVFLCVGILCLHGKHLGEMALMLVFPT